MSVVLEMMVQFLEESLRQVDTNPDEAISNLKVFKKHCEDISLFHDTPVRGFLKQYCALPSFTNPQSTLATLATESIVTQPENAKFLLGNLMPTNDTTTKGWQELRLFLKQRGFHVVSAPSTDDELERNAVEMVKDIKVHVMQELYREPDNKEYLLQLYQHKHIQLQINHHVKFMQMWILQQMIWAIFPNPVDLASFFVTTEMYCYCDDEGPSETLHFNWMPERTEDPPVPDSIDGNAVLAIIRSHSRHDRRNDRFFVIRNFTTAASRVSGEPNNGYQAEYYNPVKNKIAWTWNRKFVERELYINKCCCNFAQHLDISFFQGPKSDLDVTSAYVRALEREDNDMNLNGPQYPKLDQNVNNAVGEGWIQPWHFQRKPWRPSSSWEHP